MKALRVLRVVQLWLSYTLNIGTRIPILGFGTYQMEVEKTA
jgi:hypothetical protein